MKKVFNKASKDIGIGRYTVILNHAIAGHQGKDLYRLVMKDSQMFSAYVTGWAIGLEAMKTGHFLLSSSGLPHKNGKPDVMEGDTPAITLVCTRRFMRKFQAEFSPQIAAIRYVYDNNNRTPHEWQHPRSNAMQENKHPLSTRMAARTVLKKL